jgi:predicted site-specific integrase-resolvase
MAFLNLEQGAELFGVSAWTLRNAAKTGRLPGARKVGGRWFIHEETLRRYFTSTLPEAAA